MLEQILPREVAVAEAFGDQPGADLFPQEEAAIARAVPRRRREFATARACARAALAQLGEPPVPILRGASGAPLWPAGVAGSITHCAGYRAAAAARTSDIVTVGVDAEPDQALPGGVLDAISLPGERAHLNGLSARQPGTAHWDRLLFCAKEALYKAWFPLARQWLGFEQAEIVIDPDGGAFTARLLVPAPLAAGSPLATVRGQWLAARGLVAAAIAVPSADREGGTGVRKIQRGRRS
jgi:4'-phosphopantetheinyl transferase EntD